MGHSHEIFKSKNIIGLGWSGGRPVGQAVEIFGEDFRYCSYLEFLQVPRYRTYIVPILT
jgi:hypothetical protein